MTRKPVSEDSKYRGHLTNVAITIIGIILFAIPTWQVSQAEIDNPPPGYDYWQPIEAMGAVVYVVGIGAGRVLMGIFPAGWTRERKGMFVLAVIIAVASIWIASTANLPPLYYVAGFVSLLALVGQDYVTGPSKLNDVLETKRAAKVAKKEAKKAKVKTTRTKPPR
jgi:MFS family permease